MIRSWFKYFVYLSLIFLLVGLYRADYLKIPRIFSFSSLLVSFIFLLGGYIFDAVSWKQILKKTYYHAAFSECLAGMGLSIFGKYIPGKIWMIMGRSVYIADTNHYPLSKLSALSLNAQFITLWTGLTLGTIGLFLLKGIHLYGWLILLSWLGLTVVISTKVAHSNAERLLRILLRKNIELPNLSIQATLSVMPWFVAPWVLWSIAFYMLTANLTEYDISWIVGLAFPLAATLGVMAFIAPGGLGVREGVMVGYLVLAGIPTTEATTISVTCRLCFLIGEIFIFITGWISDRMLRKK